MSGPLAIEDVSVAYGGVLALGGVTLHIEGAQIVGLIGPNGAGKSTLLNVISGFTHASGGSISYGSVDLARVPAHRVPAAGIGRAFQHPQLAGDLTVRENLVVARHRLLHFSVIEELLALPGVRRQEREALEAADRTLARLGMTEFGDQPAAALSYGHRKKLDIGRALLGEPTLLLLDEPVAGLNERETSEIAELIRELHLAHVAILIVEHNMGFVESLCDSIVVLDAGKVIARGTHAQVMADPVVIAAYLGEEPARA